MFTWMRTHQRKLMLVITILTIVAFVWLYSAHDPTMAASDRIGEIYGRKLSETDFQRSMRKFNLAIGLGLTDYASQLSGGSEQGAAQFAINSMIIEHEGQKLGIHPDDAAVAAAITAMPVFQTGGKFDPNKYSMIFQTAFAPQGFSKSEIDELVRNSLTFDRLKKIIDSAPAVTDAELAYFGRAFQPVKGAAILFDRAAFEKDAKITDEQIEAYFKSHAAQFVTPEWRTARYVRFPLPADAKKLEGKAKIDAQQKIADASEAFAANAAEKGFEKAAKEAGLEIQTTPPFDRHGNVKAITGLENAAATSPAHALAPAVYTLSEKTPVSGVIQNGDEFLVADLAEVTPSRAMTLEETRPAIVRQLTSIASQAALDAAVTSALADLRSALKTGKPFAEAAAAAGLKTQPFENISLADEALASELRKFADSAMVLNENEVSGFRNEPTGGYAVWLEKRLPIDQKKFDAQRAEVSEILLSQRQAVLWLDWLDNAQKASGLSFAGNDRG